MREEYPDFSISIIILNKQEGFLRYLLLKYQLCSQEMFSNSGSLGHSTSQQVISWIKHMVLNVSQREKTFKQF